MMSRWLRALAAASVGVVAACQAFLVAEKDPVAAGSDASSAGDATALVGDGGAPLDAIAPSTYAAMVLSDKPFAYWTFDGPSPEEDRVSQRRARPAGSPSVTFDVVGAAGRAVKFPGDGGYLQVDDTDGGFDMLHEQSFSIELWLRPDALTGPYNDFLERRVTPLSDSYNGFVWGMDPNALVAFYMWFPPVKTDAGPNGAMEFVQNGASMDQSFVHLVVTHAAGGDYGLFVNGADGRGVFYPAAADAVGPRPMPTQPMWIGARFNGVIDELAIYRHELGVDRIKQHHSLGRR